MLVKENEPNCYKKKKPLNSNVKEKMIDTIVFPDLDGTLIDSKSINYDSFSQTSI